MRRRRTAAWIVVGVVVALVLVGAAAWLLQSGGRGAPSATPTASSTPTSTASAEERAQDALDRHLTQCASSTAASPPEHCGIRIPWGTEFSVVSGIRFRIEKLPVLVLDDDSFTASGGSLVATGTGTGQDDAARTETYRTDDWAVRGDLISDGGEVDVSVW